MGKIRRFLSFLTLFIAITLGVYPAFALTTCEQHCIKGAIDGELCLDTLESYCGGTLTNCVITSEKHSCDLYETNDAKCWIDEGSVDCGNSSDQGTTTCGTGHHLVDGVCVPNTYYLRYYPVGYLDEMCSYDMGKDELDEFEQGVGSAKSIQQECTYGQDCVVKNPFTNAEYVLNGYSLYDPDKTCYAGVDHSVGDNVVGGTTNEETIDLYAVWTTAAASCTDLTNGEYPLSDGEVTDISQCYKECETACEKPSGCPPNFASGKCTYDTDAMISGKQFYGTTTCTADDNSCPIDGTVTNNNNRCYSGYYMTPSDENVMECTKCQTLSEELGYKTEYGLSYTNSVNANLNSGPYACYGAKSGSNVCDYANRNILDSDYMPTGEVVNICPQNATCANSASQPASAYAWYPSYVAIPTSYCKFDFTCNPGYTPNTDTTTNIEYGYKKDKNTGRGSELPVTAACLPATYTITLNDTIGSGGNGTVYQKYTVGWYSDADAANQTETVTIPTLKNWTFLGYFTAETGGHEIIDATGKILMPNTTYTENTTLYAQWSQNVNKCQAGYYYNAGIAETCLAPYYCPGDGEVLVETTGCNVQCPTGSITAGNGQTLADGASSVDKCFKTFVDTDGADFDIANGTCKWDCSWEGTAEQGEYSKCDVTVLTCDAGYYNPADSKACADVNSGYYSPESELNRETCPTKVNYTVGSDGTRAANTNCFISCASYIPTVEHAKNVSVQGDTKKYFDGADYAACEYAVECETGYDAINGVNPQCAPRVVKITLDDATGTGGDGAIYQKYATGWYSDSAAVTTITNVGIPALKDHLFQGYFTATTGGNQI
ncbi:MAG: hypothetical protein IKW57_00585, partial [Alphaproteobacteria bacterium]|nr:hypothetical protein [Alphaproteobacteria bacterium]